MSDEEYEGVAVGIDGVKIVGQTYLGGLESEISAEGVPEAMGQPVFQLTFFEAGHVLLTNIDGLLPLETLLLTLNSFVETLADGGYNRFAVPTDIVDQDKDDDDDS